MENRRPLKIISPIRRRDIEETLPRSEISDTFTIEDTAAKAVRGKGVRREDPEEEKDISSDEDESIGMFSEENVFQAGHKGRRQPHKTTLAFFLVGIVALLVNLYVVFNLKKSYQAVAERERRRVLSIERRVEQLSEKLRTSRIDHADIENGASIIPSMTSDVYESRSLFGRRVRGYDGARALEDNFEKGSCFSFNGARGSIGIQFKHRIDLSSISIKHPLFSQWVSAVKDFVLYGIGDNGREIKLGDFRYTAEGRSRQEFFFPAASVTGVRLEITSNHGSEKYTCIYKVSAFE